MTEFDKVIHPGGVGKVTASVHTANFKGPITKSITVTTNDPAHAQTVLQLKATVRVPIDIQPLDTLSVDGKYGDLKAQVVTVVSTEDKPFDILSADSSDKAFTVAVIPTPPAGDAAKTAPKPKAPKAGTVGSDNKSYQVTITPGKDVQVGHSNVTVTLKTSHPKAAELPIRLFVTVRGEVEVQPERVIMQVGPNAPANGKTIHVAIRKSTGDPLKVTSVEATNPGVKTKLKTVTEGKEFDLEVSFDGAVPPNGFVDAQITVKTNDTKQPVLTIPFFART